MATNIRETREVRKLGLALSGGGFRASFFHIGVLQRLAELDLLRSVEVISTVSGGSILGALYFLFLKNLLEAKSDRTIKSEDYLKILKNLSDLFVTGVRKNPRVLAFTNVWANLKMFLPRYSRSDRMAEIYHELFYDPVSGKPTVSMKDLVIHPLETQSFNLRRDNAGRHAKVPMLIINATTLNTGRNFQFTAIDMGERFPERQTLHYDKSPILMAFCYDELPSGVHEKYKNVPLGIAVAASACVPGIFHPLALTKLYKKFTPQLVDGGVHDNQGLEALFYEGCTDIIVSDASGQMDKESKPKANFISVALRSNSVLQNRIRNLGLEFLQAHPDAEQSILHLRAGLNVEVMQPGTSPQQATDYAFQERTRDWVESARSMEEKTEYGIPRNIQLALSKIRTDLDAFSDVEAQSLMYNGYRLAERDLPPRFLQRFRAKAPSKKRLSNTPRLDFDSIQTFETGNTPSPKYLQLLASGQDVFFKIYNNLSPFFRSFYESLTIIFWLISGGAAGFGSYYVPYQAVMKLEFLSRIHWLWQTLFVLIAGTAFLLVLVPVFVVFIAMSHLVLVNPEFLRRGRIQEL